MWGTTFAFVFCAFFALTAGAPAEVVAVERDTLTTSKSSNSPNKIDVDVPKKVDVTTKKEVTKAKDPIPVNERFPHAVLVGGICGGSIISPKWILTAAHCTLNADYEVVAGTNNSYSDQAVRKEVKRYVVHPLFTVGPYWLNARRFGFKQIAARHDFLLAELEEPLDLDNKTMAAIQLDEETSHPEGIDAGFAGYGAARFGETMRHHMHAMELKTVSDEACQKQFIEYTQHDMICAKGFAPKLDSACAGDSGSGLVGEGKLLGVASWVEDDAVTCRPGTTIVFSRVAAVRDWIRQVTGV